MLNNGYRYAKKAITKLYNYSLVPYGWTKSQICRLIPKHSAEDYPIDFVVTWVDGDDPEWQKSKAEYEDEMIDDADNCAARYRNSVLIRYWFRAVEQYAPWVRKIFFVTSGQKPEWLDLNHKKLVFVKHEDFIPTQYLPTFNSRTIEFNLWRIKGLSEFFVYFNDDVIINNPVRPEDFYEGGLPKLCSIAVPTYYHIQRPENVWIRNWVNDIGIINDTFGINAAVRKYPDKFFSYLYGRDLKYNWRIFEDSYITGMYYPHLAFALLKSIFAEIWDLYGEILDASCRYRFRNDKQVTINLPILWMIFQGKFVPVGRGYYGKHLELTGKTITRIEEVVNSEARIICLNDNQYTDLEDDEILKKIYDELHRSLQAKLSERCSFELS